MNIIYKNIYIDSIIKNISKIDHLLVKYSQKYIDKYFKNGKSIYDTIEEIKK